jgi:hypothetical protein
MSQPNICPTCKPWHAKTPEELDIRRTNMMLCEGEATIHVCPECQGTDWTTSDALVVQTPTFATLKPAHFVTWFPLGLALIALAALAPISAVIGVLLYGGAAVFTVVANIHGRRIYAEMTPEEKITSHKEMSVW